MGSDARTTFGRPACARCARHEGGIVAGLVAGVLSLGTAPAQAAADDVTQVVQMLQDKRLALLDRESAARTLAVTGINVATTEALAAVVEDRGEAPSLRSEAVTALEDLHNEATIV